MLSWRRSRLDRPLPQRCRGSHPRYAAEVLTSYQVADEVPHPQMPLAELDVLAFWLYAHTLESTRTGQHGFHASLPGEAEVSVTCRKCTQRLLLSPKAPGEVTA